MVESRLPKKATVLHAILLINFDQNSGLVIIDDFLRVVVDASGSFVKLFVTEVLG